MPENESHYGNSATVYGFTILNVHRGIQNKYKSDKQSVKWDFCERF